MVNATGDRCDYKRDNPGDEDQEDDDEEISSLDAFELVVPRRLLMVIRSLTAIPNPLRARTKIKRDMH